MCAYKIYACPSQIRDEKAGVGGDPGLDDCLATAQRGKLLTNAALNAAVVDARRRHKDPAPDVELDLPRHVGKAAVVAKLAIWVGGVPAGKRRLEQPLPFVHEFHFTRPPALAIQRASR